jgi:hypothetical protein
MYAHKRQKHLGATRINMQVCCHTWWRNGSKTSFALATAITHAVLEKQGVSRFGFCGQSERCDAERLVGTSNMDRMWLPML